MKIAKVTDLMMDRIIEMAMSAVFVLHLDHSEEASVILFDVQHIAEEYDDKVIFLQIDVEENPSKRLQHCPAIQAYVRGVPTQYMGGFPGYNTIVDMIERAMRLASGKKVD